MTNVLKLNCIPVPQAPKTDDWFIGLWFEGPKLKWQEVRFFYDERRNPIGWRNRAYQKINPEFLAYHGSLDVATSN